MGGLACSVAVLLLAGAPGTARDLETTLQDDALLLHRPASEVRVTTKRIAELGADRVRLTAGWSAIAPEPRSRRKPGGRFDASDPDTYPDGAWRSLETAVRAAQAAGLKVQIDIAFWAPRWAVRRASSNPERHRRAPDPVEFAAFARAVARRFPSVSMYTTWNEPNHPAFLAPQFRRGRPISPHIYRGMHEAAYDAIRGEAPDATILTGGTSSFGRNDGVAPLRFLREMACVDAQLQPLAVPECRGFRPIRADGWSHHPYSRFSRPDMGAANPDDAPIADTPKLAALLKALHAAGRIEKPLPVYLTEYGYEPSEDDPFHPFTRDEQGTFLSHATYLAYRDPDTRMFAQFLLRDVDPRESGAKPGTRAFFRDYQTGLVGADGQLKPAATAFKQPFWAERREAEGVSSVLLFGQIRPGRGRQEVRVEREVAGAWKPVPTMGRSCDQADAAFLTDEAGFFETTTPYAGPATYRFVRRHRNGSLEASRPVSVS